MILEHPVQSGDKSGQSEPKMKTLQRVILCLPIFAVLAIAVVSSVNYARSSQRVAALQAGERDVAEHAEHLRATDAVDYPTEWIATASQLAAQDPARNDDAIALLEAALDANPNHPNAWAQLAYLYAIRAGGFDDAAAHALQNSIDLCPYCGREILRWRFTFVLQHWDAVPESLRADVFSGADFLRWWYLDYTYLNSVRGDALERGIPFDAYRRNVNTPIRPSEVQ